jgi:hypothetical protein
MKRAVPDDLSGTVPPCAGETYPETALPPSTPGVSWVRIA